MAELGNNRGFSVRNVERAASRITDEMVSLSVDAQNPRKPVVCACCGRESFLVDLASGFALPSGWSLERMGEIAVTEIGSPAQGFCEKCLAE